MANTSEQSSWCGGIWGKESIDLDDQTPAAHVVLAVKNGRLQASIEAGTKGGGVPGAGRLDLYDEHFVRIPETEKGNPSVNKIILTQDASPRPHQISDQAVHALSGLARKMGLIFRYEPTNELVAIDEQLICRASVTSKYVEIPVESVMGGEPVSYPAQYIMMGGLRAALAYSLARPEQR
jgi:hypothetical protein